jgi:hypothetical protein
MPFRAFPDRHQRWLPCDVECRRGSKVRSSSKNVARDHPLPLLCAGRRIPAYVPATGKCLRLPEVRPYLVAGRSSSALCLLEMSRSESHHQPSVARPCRNRNGHQLNFLVYVSRKRSVCCVPDRLKIDGLVYSHLFAFRPLRSLPLWMQTSPLWSMISHFPACEPCCMREAVC